MELVFLIVLIVLMIVSLSSGFPVAFALPGSAIGAIGLAAICGFLFAGDSGAYFAQDGPIQWLTAGVTNFRSLYWQVERDTLIAIPLFVFMGIMLQRSKIAEDLLVAMAQLFGPVPGGLGISVVFVGALLAATTGILGATVIAMGLISLPAMLRNNYSKPLAAGTICASGTLGQIIPPSIVLIILADQLANAADQARTIRAADYKAATGEFSMPAELDITSASAGDMFMGALVPGIILVVLYMLYILIKAILKPETAPPVPYEGKYDKTFVLNIGIALIPPLALIFSVLGSIVMGIATVNQAGAIGAVGAIVMGGYRLVDKGKHRYTPLIIAIVSIIVIFVLQKMFDLNIKNITNQRDFYGVIFAAVTVLIFLSAIIWSVWRTYRIDNILTNVMIDTAKTTSMVFIILIGAAMLTAAFRGFGGEHLVREFLTGLPGGFWTQFLVVMLVIFLLGFFLDFIEIAVVVVPIVAPILLADPSANVTAVWLGVMIGLNIQTSFLTPPFGFALFYLRGVAPPEVKTTHIYKGAMAFIVLQLAGLAIAGYFPSLVNYMPSKTYLTSENAPPPINPKMQYCIEQQVFPKYAEQKDSILNEIQSIRSLDLQTIPDRYRTPLIESLDRSENTFTLLESIDSSSKHLNEYVRGYKPVQQQVRQIKIQIRNLESRLKITSKKLNRLQRNSPDDNQIEGLKTSIYSLELNKRLLEDKIPKNWHQSHSQYSELANTDKANRVSYRRNVDAAYEPLKTIITLLDQTNQLSSLTDQLESISGILSSGDSIKRVINRIKLIESKISSLEGTTDIKALVAKSRRALKGEIPDFIAAKQFQLESIKLLGKELDWRQNALSLLDPLSQYNLSIKDTIGLRLQEQFTQSQAEDLAGCLSVHRDISLHF